MRAVAPLLLLAVLAGGCHRADRRADTLDADADARARTAAKTLDDIAAAEQASATPLPQVAAPARRVVERDEPADDSPNASKADEPEGANTD